ncbi:HAD hydrolase family [Cooperia oncophora]
MLEVLLPRKFFLSYKSVGFKNITTIEDLRVMFPDLDCLDFSRKSLDGTVLAVRRQHFLPIEAKVRSSICSGTYVIRRAQKISAVVMLGEPVGWESALQLLIDVLLTSGKMVNFTRGLANYPAQIPVIACNADLVWMAERSELPRIGHGIFIHCLETLYEKLTGRRMHYEAVLGKPTEISYLHAAHVAQRHANEMKMDAIKTLYIIGDNPMSDVLGAKLFDRYLRHGGRGRFDHVDLDLLDQEENDAPTIRTRHVVDRCMSILVETGVYKGESRQDPS